MSRDHATRLYQAALTRLTDADILSRYCLDRNADSDSDELLRILALELLLKCAVLLNDKKSAPHHQYADDWNQLPQPAQTEVLRMARERMPGTDPDLADMPKLLGAFRWLFTQGRYYHDLYRRETLEQQHAAGLRWLADGARWDKAKVRYYHEALVCLIHGLSSYIKPRLDA